MSSSSQGGESWIASFCGLLGHEYFAEVSEDFIEDDFNLTGLQSQVPMYKEALEMILDVEPEEDEEEEEEEEEDDDDDDGLLGDDPQLRGPGAAAFRKAERRHMRMASDLSMIESSAELLYGLIHQRYIISRPGIQQMLEKYELCHFGVCPRLFCNGCKVLPVGCSDTPGQDTVKLFCPSCLDVYTPPNSRFQTVDGAFFGTTFGCLFFMTFPDLDVGASQATPRAGNPPTDAFSSPAVGVGSSSSAVQQSLAHRQQQQHARAITEEQPAVINGIVPSNLAPGLGPGNIYEPRIYGFRVSERARSGPRMQWLRSRPTNVNELDEVKQFEEMMRGEEAQEAENLAADGAVEGDGASADQKMLDASQDASAANGEDPNGGRKKKKPVRRSKGGASSTLAATSSNGTNGGAVSPMETNGVGDAG